MTPEVIAAICHEANRRYCQEIGDHSQKVWEEASWWQKQSAIAGVLFIQRDPEAPLSALHDNWLAQKAEEGWKYGEVKSEDERLHPCMVPYDQLPPEQRVKDKLFKNVTLALTQGEQNV